MSHVRTIVFFAVWIPCTAALGIIALPALIHRKCVWWVADIWSFATLEWLRISCGITSEVRSSESLLSAEVIYASKHQSAWDTLMLWRTLNRPLFILKRELYFIPFFGWYLWRSEQIAINRSNRRQAMEHILLQANSARKQARPLVIFPEGTRTKPGANATYHSGVAKLSAALNWPVIPVALNAGKFWPKRPIWKKSGHAVMAFLPIMPACGNDKAAWMKELQSRIESASRAL